MKRIHHITWKSRFNETNTDLSFEIVEEDCHIKSVTHPIAKWMIGEAWFRCYEWLVKKHAEITSTEAQKPKLPCKNEDLYHFTAKNPRKLNGDEWAHRIYYTKG